MRVAIAIGGLTAWLSLALGLRAYFGGRAYLAELFGSDALAAEVFERALEQPEALLMGMSPWSLLLAASVLVSAALVLLVLWPVDRVLARLGVGRGARVVVAAALSSAVAGALLLSIHPLLAMPSVPEGPRTVLNYACEAAGYGWVNAVAHGGAIVTGVGFAWFGRDRVVEAKVAAKTASHGAQDDPHDDPEDDADAEDATPVEPPEAVAAAPEDRDVDDGR